MILKRSLNGFKWSLFFTVNLPTWFLAMRIADSRSELSGIEYLHLECLFILSCCQRAAFFILELKIGPTLYLHKATSHLHYSAWDDCGMCPWSANCVCTCSVRGWELMLLHVQHILHPYTSSFFCSFSKLDPWRVDIQSVSVLFVVFCCLRNKPTYWCCKHKGSPSSRDTVIFANLLKVFTHWEEENTWAHSNCSTYIVRHRQKLTLANLPTATSEELNLAPKNVAV